jgi:hypothetical protein
MEIACSKSKLNGEVEGTPDPQLTFGPHSSSHELRQASANGEPEPRASESPGRRGVCLGKWVEDAIQIGTSNADPRVSDDELQSHVGCRLGFNLGADVHPTVLRELDRIIDDNG